MSRMSHWGATSLMRIGIPWSFVKAEIPRTETSGDRIGHLYFFKVQLVQGVETITSGWEELRTIPNCPGKINAANLKGFFSKSGEDLTTHSPQSSCPKAPFIVLPPPEYSQESPGNVLDPTLLHFLLERERWAPTADLGLVWVLILALPSPI